MSSKCVGVCICVCVCNSDRQGEGRGAVGCVKGEFIVMRLFL